MNNPAQRDLFRDSPDRLFPQKQPEEAVTFWKAMGLWMVGEGPDPRE